MLPRPPMYESAGAPFAPAGAEVRASDWWLRAPCGCGSWHTSSMATRKITITVPDELVESIKGRVEARGVSAYIAAAAAHQDAMDRLRELGDRLEDEYGSVTAEEERAALERIAAIDDWHDEKRSPGAAA